MILLSPLALFGLLAAAVPPLLHLFQRREPPVVEFPAVRYLLETKREAQRTVQLQHLLLMLLRILAVVLIAVAAARPVVNGGGGAHHEPTALVMILDNSLSSGAVQGGTRVLDDLALRARETMRDAQDGDAVWLMTADGIARRARPGELLAELPRIAPDARRLDLDAAVRQAASLVATAGYAHGEVHLLSDLQKTAIGSEESRIDSSLKNLSILVYHPKGDPPPNRGAIDARPSPSLWLTSGGDVRVSVGGGPAGGAPPATVQLELDGHAGARALAGAAGSVELAAARLQPGWHTGVVTLDPDELRADDRRPFAVRVLAPASVSVSPDAGPFVAEAVGVLTAGGQVRSGGTDVRVGGAPGGTGAAVIILPPADASAAGALNRALESAGVAWRFGARVDRQDTLVAPDVPELAGIRVMQRWRLEPAAGRNAHDSAATVVARAGADPWLVKAGRFVLVGSRFVPEQTTLPLSGSFVPFIAALVNRVARGENGVSEAAPGESVTLPAGVTAIAGADSVIAVTGGVIDAPAVPGAYALRRGHDTVGLLVVGADARESDLTRAREADVAVHWPGARVSVTDDPRVYAAERFRGAGRSEITGPLLALALLVLIVEALLAAGAFARLSRLPSPA